MYKKFQPSSFIASPDMSFVDLGNSWKFEFFKIIHNSPKNCSIFRVVRKDYRKSLKPFKTKVTKTGNTLEELIVDSQHLLTFTIPLMENEEESIDLLSTKKNVLKQRHANITSAKNSLDAAVASFEEAFNRLDDRAQLEEQASQECYLDHAWDLSSTAEAVLGKLAETEIEISSTLENIKQTALRRQRRVESAGGVTVI